MLSIHFKNIIHKPICFSRLFTTNSFKMNESDYRLFTSYRFNPAKDCKPHMESYAVNLKE